MIVGLTGGIGSGKTTVLDLFKTIGNIATYNADVEAKKLMNSSETIRKKLINIFGKASFQDGVLNRKYLSKVVFSDKEKLRVLNSIVHPEVYAHLQAFVLSHKDKDYIVYESAILFENNSDAMCDCVITVVADESLKIKRVLERDQTTTAAVLSRMNNQWSDVKKTLQSNYIIENYELSETTLQIERIHNNLTKKRV